jgi:hypothetical protein
MNEQDKDCVAYCGLYCGDCPIGKGEIADLAERLMDKLRETDFSRIARGLSRLFKEFKELKRYPQFAEVLATMQRLRCQKPCRYDGGEDSCRIRTCCRNENIAGCWQCEEFENCKKLAWIEPVNHDAHLKNLRMVKKQGIDGFLKGKRHW